MAYLLINESFNKKFTPLRPVDIVQEFLEKDKLDSMFMILPTSKLVKYFRSNIIREFYKIHKKPISQINIYSINQFIKLCFDKIFFDTQKTYKILSEAYSLTLFKEAVEKSNLNYFTSSSKSANLILRLFSIINGLREDGMGYNALFSDLESHIKSETVNVDIKKLGDITEIMKNYEDLLGENFLDSSSILKWILKYFKDEYIGSISNINEIIGNPELIYFWGFTEFKQPESEFVNLFKDTNSSIAVHLDYSVQDGPLLGKYETTIEQLSSFGFKIAELEQTAKSIKTQFIRNYLFKDKTFENKTDLFNDTIRIFAVRNRLDEVRTIGKLIKILNTDEGIDLSDICVSMRNPDKYSDLFREVFYQYSIPSNITNRIYLKNSPLVSSIFSIFDMITKKYKKRDISGALKNPFFKLKEISSDSKLNIDNLISIANAFRIDGGIVNGGEKKWFSSLEFAEDVTDRRLFELMSFPNEDDEQELRSKEILKQNILKAKQDFKAIISHFKTDNKLSAEQFEHFVKYKIISALAINETIAERYKSISMAFKNQSETENLLLFENIEKESRAFYSFIQVLEELVNVIKDRYGNNKFDFNYFVDLLRTSVEGKRYQIREKSNYGVTVTSIEQTRGIPYKVMILCGMLENEFPLLYIPEVFLGKEIPETEIRHNISEKLLFFQFLTNSPELLENNEKQIYITYPKYEDKNQLSNSRFIDDLLIITNLKVNDRVFDFTKSIVTEDDLVNRIINLSCSKAEFTKSFNNYTLNDKDTGTIEIIDDCRKSILLNNYFDLSHNSEKFLKLSAQYQGLLEKYSNKIYSITEFERFRECSEKYFITNVLKIKEDEQKDISFSPLETGIILHSILYRFYLELQHLEEVDDYSLLTAKNDSLANLNTVVLDFNKRDEYLSKLLEIGRQEFEKLKYEHPLYEIDKDKIIGNSGMKGLLEFWLDEELAKLYYISETDLIQTWNFHPALFELSFGQTRENSSSKYLVLENGIKVRGKIDRLEFFAQDDKIYYLVADYKSKSANQGGDKEIRNHKKFQIPLYLHASEEYIKTNYNFSAELVPSGGVYYSYKNYRKQEKTDKSTYYKLAMLSPECSLWAENNHDKNQIKSIEDFYGLKEEIINETANIAREIAAAEFELTDNVQYCRNCKLQSLCRLNDVKPEFDEDEDYQSINT